MIWHEQQHGLYTIRVDPGNNEGVFGQSAHFLSINGVISLRDDENDDTIGIACDKCLIMCCLLPHQSKIIRYILVTCEL